MDAHIPQLAALEGCTARCWQLSNRVLDGCECRHVAQRWDACHLELEDKALLQLVRAPPFEVGRQRLCGAVVALAKQWHTHAANQPTPAGVEQAGPAACGAQQRKHAHQTIH